MELALNVTFVGLLVVFIALILLSLIISLFSKIINTGKTGGKKDGMNARDNGVSVPETQKDVETESALYAESKDDSELIAVLTAAVIAAMGGSAEPSIRVKSYRRIPQVSPVWNTVSRKEQLAAKL